ncbi:hypothetical protein K2Z84_23340 [Candidatus Binatia bacterium]|jgi:hypothetical protein|nr:hypothetical protein [Candidatus Binatia bacterium]
MSARAVIVLVAACLASAAPRAAHGDGGLVRASGVQNGLLVTLFTTPTPLRVGSADVSVLVQDAATRAPILDAQVSARVSPQHEGALPATALLDRAGATNQLLQAAPVTLPIPGPYRIVVEARRGVARALLATDVTVEPALPPLLALWPYLALPPLVIGLFLVQQILRHRSRGDARTGPGVIRRGGAS